MSLVIIKQSFDPVDIILPFHDIAPIRSEWPLNEIIFCLVLMSYNSN